ncbi:hypothetical protein N4P33_08980 [Streptomyces sp. 15-116A]|uniref:hypothetical protein n=1 Tax=Streptomyces sp. 15-116A TaxID=2259035 RepID=UPI0021B1D8D6|nr:hypothetical protein [Streptomyces sp. 15-116A]MCT7352308.1 hypothetical protein [Streptomyces sp. 15-116A]
MMDAQPLGRVNLFVPKDWFDLLSDGMNREATRSRCADIVRRTYPTVPGHRQDQFVDALMEWHTTLLTSGVLLYGIVSAPLPEEPETAVNWQVMAGVIDVPNLSADVDLGALLSQAYGARMEGPSYQESFTTDMGIGFGFISQPVVGPRDGSDSSGATIGLVGALSCPPGGRQGLLVIGISLTPEHVWELAGLVSAIAGRSTFEEPPLDSVAVSREPDQ